MKFRMQCLKEFYANTLQVDLVCNVKVEFAGPSGMLVRGVDGSVSKL